RRSRARGSRRPLTSKPSRLWPPPPTQTSARAPATTTHGWTWRSRPDQERSHMTPPPVDPNAVLMTGENSFIRLSPDGAKTLVTRASHWRVLWCPAGSGHTLFLQSDLTDGKPRVYADNPAVARWLQTTIEALLFPTFAD